MDDHPSKVDREESVRERIFRYSPFALSFIGILFIVLGIVSYRQTPSSAITILDEVKESTPQTISVDVAGAVVHSGVYRLPADSRIQDALSAAGEITGEADASFVDRNLNRASKLTDGAKIYIPKKNEQVKEVATVQGVSIDNFLLNINTASASELDRLPSIGPATAQKIIDGRPYQRIEELVEKKITTKTVFEKIKGKITL